MQTYLKTKPVGIQLLLFMGMAFGLFYLFYMVGALVLTQVTGLQLADIQDSAKWNEANPNYLFFIRGLMLVQFLGLFLVPSLLFAYFADPHPFQFIGFRKPHHISYWILGIAVMLVALPLAEWIGLLNKKMAMATSGKKWIDDLEQEAAKQIRFMMKDRTPGELITNLVFISGFAALGEELFFRGILQRLFIQLTKNPWIGIIITAILFSGFHFQFFGFLPRLLLGILLGLVYWYSGSLWPAILAHFVYDALIIIILYFRPELAQDPDSTLVKPSQLIGAALASAGLTLFVIMQMIKRSRSRYEEVYAEPVNPNDKFSF